MELPEAADEEEKEMISSRRKLQIQDILSEAMDKIFDIVKPRKGFYTLSLSRIVDKKETKVVGLCSAPMPERVARMLQKLEKNAKPMPPDAQKEFDRQMRKEFPRFAIWKKKKAKIDANAAK